MLGGKCVICGTTQNLQFDHINPAEKEFDVGQLLNYAQIKILEELKKCQLLCDTHHTQKSKANGEYRGGHNKIDIKNASHGTSIMYHKFKCKCEECKQYKRNSRK